MSTTLLRAAALLVLLAFTVQGLSTTAKRLWSPSHHHVASPAPAAKPVVAVEHGALAAAAIAVQHGDERALQQPGHVHGPGSAQEHGDRQADAASAAWLQADAARRASAFVRGPSVGFAGNGGITTPAPAPGNPQTSKPVQHASAPHQHATGSSHRHDSDQPGVVYVDAGADPQAPPALASGFKAYWSIVPSGLHLVLRRLRTAPPGLTLLAHASRGVGPHERPPRG